mmetsp:Transcript_25123/g.37968  ORF Transcript_25123/g.37968 Transcript_25123/m.37968 type:complete len:313 (+) Transcript_25123:59-997(+)
MIQQPNLATISIQKSSSFQQSFLRHLLLAFLLITTSFHTTNTATAVTTAAMVQTQTYYEVLEIQPSATLQDIKKSYRKLALLHHPDRNPPKKKDEATGKFRQVNEAYEVLSDEDKRRIYDADLRSGRPYGGGGASAGRSSFHNGGHGRHHGGFRDPFAQFNDLFQSDPFFNEAFKDMDDLFAKTFQQQHGSGSRAGSAAFAQKKQVQQPRSWGRWIADSLGIDFQISTSTTTMGADGRPHTSRTYTSNGQATYTSKSTRTVIENGQRVTIQSLEKDGNKIEEKYINNQLVSRNINGIPEEQYRERIAARGDL